MNVTFKVNNNYALGTTENDILDSCLKEIAVLYFDDIKLNIAKDWKKDWHIRPYRILTNEIYNFSIVEGFVPHEDLELFREFANKLDQAHSIMRDDYPEIKTYFTLCIEDINRRIKNDIGGSIRDNSE